MGTALGSHEQQSIKSSKQNRESQKLDYQIKRAKQEWEATVDALPQVICLINSDSEVIRSNRSIENWGQISVSEVKGKQLHTILHPECKRDDCYFDSLWLTVQDDMRLGKELHYEIEDSYLDRVLEFQFQAIDDKLKSSMGQQHTALYINDITRRYQAESTLQNNLRQLATLHQVQTELSSTLNTDEVLTLALNAAFALSSADLGCIAITDDDGYLYYSCVQGYPEEYIGQMVATSSPLYRVINNQQPELLTEQINKRGMASTSEQITIPLLARGSIIGILSLESTSNSTLTDESFEFIKLLGTSIAISYDNARLYQLSQNQLSNLKSLYAQVSALEELKTEIIRLAAHDIKTPISTIVLHADLIDRAESEVLTQYGQDKLDSIRTGAYRAKNIIDDILSLEKIYSLSNSGSKEIVDLSMLLRDKVQFYRDIAKSKNIMVTSDLPSGSDFVVADEALLNECISNLLDNAIKYTPDGGHISITLSIQNKRAELRVHDTGYGIPKAQQDQLFEPFYRAVSYQSISHIDGTGLGLSLVKNVIERFEGDIYFESEFGKGSVFGFNLPVTVDIDLKDTPD